MVVGPDPIASTSAEPEGAEQVGVELALDLDRVRGVPGEHADGVLVDGPGGDQRQRAGVRPQVVAVLHDEVLERLVVERPVGQPGDERVLDDPGVHRGGAGVPQLGGKRHPQLLSLDCDDPNQPAPEDYETKVTIGLTLTP